MAALGEQPVDLVVIGAGLTGAAIARDAALRGLQVMLVDQADLGGASAPPLSLVGPTDRGELRLLEDLAPHLVRAHPLVFEADPGGRRALRWALRRRGLFARNEGLRRGSSPPSLPEGVPGWAGLASEQRLALALARSAHDAGAQVLPWFTVEGLVVERARVQGIEYFDRLGGLRGRTKAAVVVDATGPWTDRTRGLRGPRPRRVNPGRCAAISLPCCPPAEVAGLRLASGVVALPHAGRTLVLGAEEPHGGDFDTVVPSPTQVARLRAELARAWPDTAAVSPSGAWAGLVVRAAEGAQIPCVLEGEDGLISVLGGRAGTHRTLAARALVAVARSLRAAGIHVGGCMTGAVPLPGAERLASRDGRLHATGPGGQEAERVAREQLPPGCAAHLLTTYGGRWHEVAALVVEQPELGMALVPGLPLLAAQVPWALAEERVCSLPDLLRRLDLPLLALAPCEDLLPQLGTVLAAAQGWSAQDTARQVEFARSGLAPLASALGG